MTMLRHNTFLGEQGYAYVPGHQITRTPDEVLIKNNLRAYFPVMLKSISIRHSKIHHSMLTAATGKRKSPCLT